MLVRVRQAVLVVNPFATGVTERRIAAVEAALSRVAEVRTVLTARPGHATELVTEACGTGACEAVFVFSGDGGFNEAVNGVDGRVPIGFLPGGGTSVLPRALGIPSDPADAAEQLAAAFAERRVRKISVGRVNGRRFTFAAGIGFDAEAVRRVDRLGRRPDGRRPGDARFAAAIVRMLFERRARYDSALEIDGLGRAAFLLVANCSPYTYALGRPLTFVPGADFELGLDLVAPVRVTPRSAARLVRYAFRGHGQEDDPEVLYVHDRDRIEVVCDRPLPLQADGEDLGDVERALFEAERGALQVLV
jgi:diacylglycerol kinase family enzyme